MILAKKLNSQMAWEAKWDETLEESQDVLDRLSCEAKKEHEERHGNLN